MKKIGFFPFILCSLLLRGQDNLPKITKDFPGGNIYVENITLDTIWLKPDLRDTNGDWFYWFFKVSGVSGRTITFQFIRNHVFTTFGPAYSLNNSDNWSWLGENSVGDNRFTFCFDETDTIAYFSMAMPYTEKDYYNFLEKLKNRELWKADTLCYTRQSRIVEELYIKPQNHEAPIKVLITARHHACEMMANYVLEGIIESILDESTLQHLREKVEFRIIPFVDKDGVENGDQGKNRIPRDHNRDYNNTAIYSATMEIRKKIPQWADTKLKIALDLHCPWISGKYNEWIYIVGSSNPENERQQKKFSKLLEKHSHSELKFEHANFLPFGEAWNKPENFDQGMSFTRWALSIDGIKLSTTLEFPYANVSGTHVSKENAWEFGKSIAFAIQEFLQL